MIRPVRGKFHFVVETSRATVGTSALTRLWPAGRLKAELRAFQNETYRTVRGCISVRTHLSVAREAFVPRGVRVAE